MESFIYLLCTTKKRENYKIKTRENTPTAFENCNHCTSSTSADKFVLTVSRVVGMPLASNSAFAEIGGRGHKPKGKENQSRVPELPHNVCIRFLFIRKIREWRYSLMGVDFFLHFCHF